MYAYSDFDKSFLASRNAQFRAQVERRIAGHLTEDEFKPLRLMNGVYLQLHAYMLRVAIPYGTLNSGQMNMLAHLADKYDKGYGHFTTRQNIQYNWPELRDIPDMLDELGTVEMHAIQTSGNTIRNVTADHFAGAAADEIADPRPVAELIRQWSTDHPEFQFLPRKFKVAVTGSESDRAVTRAHDIGLRMLERGGVAGFEIIVGGGLGRTPMLGKVIAEFLPREDLLPYLEAIVSVYNLLGRRDNKYKARIKILVKAMGIAAFREAVEQEWKSLKGGASTLTQNEIDRAKSFFTEPAYAKLDAAETAATLNSQCKTDLIFANWVKRNTVAHRVSGYRIVNISLKATGYAPGDITDKQLELIADLADKYSFGEVRSTHQQNLVLADVEQTQLKDLWHSLQKAGLATANIGYLTDMICCPGGDYCSLANAKSIPVAEAIQSRFDDMDYVYDLGPLELNVSGCMNACGHHHIGHIGILGVDKKGQEFYQVSLGGHQGKDASIGKILGPSFKQDDMPEVIDKLLTTFVGLRQKEETFLETYRRVGIGPFKERVYA
jgi:sulfite reductase (NADPH) hemoprotein beta-component